MKTLSENTQAILLLTAPLIVTREAISPEYLTLGEYKQLAICLMKLQKEPADLLGNESEKLLSELGIQFDRSRLEGLLGRGFLLSQAIDYWEARGIWVISRADQEYPGSVKSKLKDKAPPILYGCGDSDILNSGGLAVVGSRNVDEELLVYTQNIGRIAAASNIGIVSGGARGIDRSAMRGALESDGCVIGVLADSLIKASVERSSRQYFIDERLVLITPFDPSAGFNVGNAMQRNKLIYALADAALVVNSDYKTGGTWAGAYEQLTKLKYVPIFVRDSHGRSEGLNELEKLGAQIWPNPQTKEELEDIIQATAQNEDVVQHEMSLPVKNEMISMPMLSITAEEPAGYINESEPKAQPEPKSDLQTRILSTLEREKEPITVSKLTKILNESESKIRKRLNILISEDKVMKISKSPRYTLARPGLL